MRIFDEFVKVAAMESPNEEEKKTMHEEETAIDAPVGDEKEAKPKKKLSDSDKRALLKMFNLHNCDKKD